MLFVDLFEAIYTRRSVRRFLSVPVEFDKVVEVVRAGAYAPCSGNLQNWKFIVETGQDRIKELYHYTLEQEAFLTATVAIIVVAETEIAERFYGLRGKRLYAVQNCAAAAENMLLAAHALGLGAVWIGAFDENKINEMYQIPGNARAQMIILLGYPDEKPTPRHVKDLWYLINFRKYGSKYQHPHLITHDLAVEWDRRSKEWGRAVERYQERVRKELAERGLLGKGGSGEQGGAPTGGSGDAENFFEKARTHTRRVLDSLKKEAKK